jgi:hypothetical protein
MADTIIDGTQFNSENVYYSAPKANASGGKSVNILNKGTKSGLRIVTPLMLTWGATEFEGNGKFDMSLQFPRGEYMTEDTTEFLERMKAFEEKIKTDALTNSKDWFGKVHKNAEVVEALYSPMLKYSKDKFTGEPDLTKAPTLRVKLPLWEGVWKCLVCDEDNNKLFPGASGVSPLDFIKKGTNLAIIMQCGGIWFANGKFGVTWKLVQAVVQNPKPSLLDECLIKLKPSDKAKLKAAAPVEEDDNDVMPSTLVDDSDEEDEEPVAQQDVQQDAEVEEAAALSPSPSISTSPAVVEEPKKKKVVKKKTDA